MSCQEIIEKRLIAFLSPAPKIPNLESKPEIGNQRPAVENFHFQSLKYVFARVSFFWSDVYPLDLSIPLIIFGVTTSSVEGARRKVVGLSLL